MKIEDIIVNPDNHHQYDTDKPSWYDEWNESLDAHVTVNEYLDFNLIGNKDWTGRYLRLLDRCSIPGETENGWYSIQAVDPRNIESYVKYETAADYKEAVDKAISVWERLKGKLTHTCQTIDEFVEVLTSLAY